MEYNRRQSKNNGLKEKIKMSGKTALITGGARGIGLGISKKLVEEDWNIALTGRKDINEVYEIIEDLKSSGTQVQYYQSDISLRSHHQKLIDSIRKDFGTLNLLVNNAGVAPLKRVDILEAEEESFDRLIEINLKGPFFLTKDAAQWMISQREDDCEEFFSIINIGSVSSEIPSPSRGDYCISKAGISMATKLWAARLGEYNISVYEIQPGLIKTDMTDAVTGKYDKMIEEGLLLQSRWGFPSDVGKTVASLARGDMPYSTGQVIRVDGGLTMQRL
jgi:NAD(P)-dependent dehydrogenase (short-subunit alcohol dehydrogenase family)